MKRIAYAEDHEGMRYFYVSEFRDVLDRHDITAEIDSVDNGRDLVDLVLKRKYDLVFTDFSMPGLSGLDAIAEIRKEDTRIPIYVLSLGARSVKEKVMDAGATGYIEKTDIMVRKKIEKAILEHLSD